MSNTSVYCLDANVLIEAWQKYYSPSFCAEYWQILNQFGKEQRIFIPKLVYNEITRTKDDLAAWLQDSDIPIQQINGNITACLNEIYKADPRHKFLVDNTKQRSLADPWVIAHAIHSSACVVTKESLATATNSKKIKIPNVCNNMGVRWINDFSFIQEMNITFSCKSNWSTAP